MFKTTKKSILLDISAVSNRCQWVAESVCANYYGWDILKQLWCILK